METKEESKSDDAVISRKYGDPRVVEITDGANYIRKETWESEGVVLREMVKSTNYMYPEPQKYGCSLMVTDGNMDHIFRMTFRRPNGMSHALPWEDGWIQDVLTEYRVGGFDVPEEIRMLESGCYMRNQLRLWERKGDAEEELKVLFSYSFVCTQDWGEGKKAPAFLTHVLAIQWNGKKYFYKLNDASMGTFMEYVLQSLSAMCCTGKNFADPTYDMGNEYAFDLAFTKMRIM